MFSLVCSFFSEKRAEIIEGSDIVRMDYYDVEDEL